MSLRYLRAFSMPLLMLDTLRCHVYATALPAFACCRYFISHCLIRWRAAPPLLIADFRWRYAADLMNN